MDIVDCAIVGGGAAGLTAAVYLGRFNRTVAVFDNGRSRLMQIPLSRNVPGFPDGIAGSDLRSAMVTHALRYGAQLRQQRVISIARDETLFRLITSAGSLQARAVIIATGVAVAAPEISDHDAAVQAGLIRYCPICDGPECAGKRVGVLGNSAGSIEEAIFLRTWVEDVTWMASLETIELSAGQIASAAEHRVSVEAAPIEQLLLREQAIEARFANGDRRLFDVIYPCLGSAPRSELARALGAEVTPAGGLLVDSRMQTNVPMLYVAGDVLEGLDQISSACGQAAIAATSIHNHLRRT